MISKEARVKINIETTCEGTQPNASIHIDAIPEGHEISEGVVRECPAASYQTTPDLHHKTTHTTGLEENVENTLREVREVMRARMRAHMDQVLSKDWQRTAEEQRCRELSARASKREGRQITIIPGRFVSD